jgi:molybdenum cofactor synthesis domain-containing protein
MMIPLADAQAEVIAACPPRVPRPVDVADALGLVLAEPVSAAEPVPPFANTAMDGYAVRAADTTGATAERPARLRVIGTLGAGRAPDTSVGPGEALRIMTGAPFPDGADAVAIVETTSTDGEDVLVSDPAAAGEHVRRAGEDIEAGQEVFGAGTVLGPGHLGVLSSVGREKVAVVPAPVVAVLSTGDELVEGAAALLPGQIHDSNRRTLAALLRRDGFGVVDLGIARDQEADIEARLRDGAARCDAVVTSGGVSMGEYDLVKAVLDRIGRMHWMQVAIRPAKPFAFGVIGETPVFGLPGNPVSSMVSYEVLARPGLRRMAGRADADLRRLPLAAIVDGGSLRGAGDGRTSFVRVVAGFQADGRCHVRSAGGQGSHQLYAMAQADGLAVVAPGKTVPAGAAVDVLLLGP